MSYIDLINEFWLKDEEHSFSGSETRLYFYLLKCANFRRWKTDTLTFANGDLMRGVRITANTLKDARNRLATCGMIGLKVKHANQRGRRKKGEDKCDYRILGMKLSIIDNSTDNYGDNFTDNSGDNSTHNTTDNYPHVRPSQSGRPQAPKKKIEEEEKNKENVCESGPPPEGGIREAHTHSELKEKVLQMEQDLKALKEQAKRVRKRPPPRVAASPPPAAPPELPLNVPPPNPSLDSLVVVYSQVTGRNGEEARRVSQEYLDFGEARGWLTNARLPVMDKLAYFKVYLKNERPKPAAGSPGGMDRNGPFARAAPAAPVPVHKTPPVRPPPSPSEEARGQFRRLMDAACISEEERMQELAWCGRSDISDEQLEKAAAWWQKQILQRSTNSS